MKILLAGMLIIYTGIARANLEDDSQWAFGVGVFWEDRCYTTSIEDCVVQGNEIRIRRDSRKYSVTASYSHFSSEDGGLVGNLFELGVEDRFESTRGTRASLFAMLNVEPDESRDANGTNSNFNKGYSMGATVSRHFNDPVPMELGMGLTYEDKQNCSHPDCHALKEKKGRIELLQASLFFRSPLRNPNLSLTSSLSQIVYFPNKGSTNGRTQRGPAVRIGVEYRP